MALTLTRVSKFLSYTDGRDKLYKFAHYGAKFVGYVFATLLHNQQRGDYFYNIDKTVSDGRKLLRLLKFVDEIHKLRTMDTMRETRPLFILGHIGKCVFMGLYFLFNNISWLAAHKIVDVNEKKWAKLSLYCWLFGLLFAFAMDATLYRENKAKQIKAKGKKEGSVQELRHLQAQEYTLKLTLLRELANIQISSSLVDINPIGNNGLTGLAGVLEAVLGGYQIWTTKCREPNT